MGEKDEDATRYPQSLKGRPTLKDSEEALISPLGAGGKKDEKAELSPLGVGGKKSKNDTDLNPQSLKGRPTLKNSDQALISPLGAGGKKDVTNENNYNMFYGATPIIFERAASLRRNMTSEEIKVWNFLKSKPLGFKFRRQHPIDLFIADFYCHDVKLVIEIDGINHQYSLEADLNRENILKSFGITILRFKNTQVHSNLEGVIHKILEEANHLKNPPSKKLNHLL
jgi:very-short-patch-repair endonuclease